LLVALSDGGEILQLVAVHELGAEMHHQRGLAVAAMDAVAVLDVRIDVLGPEMAPAGFHRQHAALHAQLAGDDVEHRDVATMAVDEDHLADAGAGDLEPDMRPGVDKVGGKAADRAMLPGVLVGLADGLYRQDTDIEIGGGALHQKIEMALVD